ncbi:MAG: helix-turn-helix domain-containing protein [Sphingobacterium sp.]|jgi:transcriptional regulator with XRE-family HTH domain|nr:helix-turn-helix domain-containing protein [Sphingobacterium sp.]
MDGNNRIIVGKNLKTVREKLMFSRSHVEKKAKISSTKLESIENGEDPIKEEYLENLLNFYGLTIEEISTPIWLLTRDELLTKLKKKHPLSAYLDIVSINKPRPIDVISQIAIPNKLMNSPISSNELCAILKDKFGYILLRNSIDNALANLEKQNILELSSLSPKRYRIFNGKHPVQIDSLREIVNNLQKMININTNNIVNLTFTKTDKNIRRWAKVLVDLKDGDCKSSGELFLLADISDSSNSMKNIIKPLIKLEIIEPTEEASKSSLQKYRITQTGRDLLITSGHL